MGKRTRNKQNFNKVVANLKHPESRITEHRVDGVTDKETAPVIIRSTPIAWGIPMDEVLYSKFLTIFVKNANVMPWDGFLTTESTYLPKARNEIHRAFVEDSDLPYLMMLDSDVMFPPNIVERLMAHKLPIVGGWYKNKQVKMPPHPIIYDFVSEGEHLNWRHRDEPGTGLEQVDGMGAGCWLMSREVAEAVGTQPYDMNKGTEDMLLCKKLMDLNIPLYVDWDLPCAHLGVQWV